MSNVPTPDPIFDAPPEPPPVPVRPRQIARYGWHPPLPRLHKPEFTAVLPFASLPPSVDLRSRDAPIYDQVELGSCVYNAIGALGQFAMQRAGSDSYLWSRLFGYYNGRALEGTIASDSGTSVADGITVAVQDGFPPESDWPYDIGRFAQKPPQAAYADGRQRLGSQQFSLDTTDIVALKSCLAQGWPFVFGFTVYESFEGATVAAGGVVPMPRAGEQVLGGHCMMAVGYFDDKGAFLVRNSWGTDWGQAGYCLFPYGYLTNPNLAGDAWTLHSVASAVPVPVPVPTPVPIPSPSAPPLLTVGSGGPATAIIPAPGRPAIFTIAGPHPGRVQLLVMLSSDFGATPKVILHVNTPNAPFHTVPMNGGLGEIPVFPGGPFLLEVTDPNNRTGNVVAMATYLS